MKKQTAKQLALKINPNLFTEKDRELNVVVRDKEKVYGRAFYAAQAWHTAYHTLAEDQFKVNDLLVMADCYEAERYSNRIWVCRHQSYKASSGDYWVFLEGFSGAFICEYLRKATDQEIQRYLQSDTFADDADLSNKTNVQNAYDKRQTLA